MAKIEDINNSDAINRIIDLTLQKGAAQIGAWLEGRIVETIDAQNTIGLGWPALAPATVRRKRKKARRILQDGEKAWVDTGELRAKITSMTRRTGGREYTAFVGVFDEENALKATWLEFGTATIPERPLFRKVTARVETRLYENLETFMAGAFAQALQETLKRPPS